MKKISSLFFVFLLLPNILHAATWHVDKDHSASHFFIQHMGITNVRGSVNDTTGNLVLNDDTNTFLSLELTISLATITTGLEKRDTHLKGADFFDIIKYPTITFRSLAIPQHLENQYTISGDLTLHGITKRIDLQLIGLDKEIKDPWGNIRRGAQIKTVLDRRDFGFIYAAELETGDLLIADEVYVVIDLEFVKDQS